MSGPHPPAPSPYRGRGGEDRGFALRGLKGLWWEPEQYVGWPAFLAQAGYDLFMLCYTFCPETGLRWRQPFRDAERAVIRQLAADCADHGLTLCLALHPLIAGQAWAPDEAAVRFARDHPRVDARRQLIVVRRQQVRLVVEAERTDDAHAWPHPIAGLGGIADHGVGSAVVQPLRHRLIVGDGVDLGAREVCARHLLEMAAGVHGDAHARRVRPHSAISPAVKGQLTHPLPLSES